MEDTERQFYMNMIIAMTSQIQALNMKLMDTIVAVSTTEDKKKEQFDNIMQLMMLKMVGNKLESEAPTKMKCRQCGNDTFEPVEMTV